MKQRLIVDQHSLQDLVAELTSQEIPMMTGKTQRRQNLANESLSPRVGSSQELALVPWL